MSPRPPDLLAPAPTRAPDRRPAAPAGADHQPADGTRTARHEDHVLALVLVEEAVADHHFARWLVAEGITWRTTRPALPAPAPSRVEVGTDGPAGAYGLDPRRVDLALAWESGHRVALRLVHHAGPGAPLGPNPSAGPEGASVPTVFVGPRPALAGAGSADGLLAVEDVIERLRTVGPADDAGLRLRGQWRSLLLEDLLAAADPAEADTDADARARAFADHCRTWLSHHQPAAVPADRPGTAEDPGWLAFEWPAGLVYKASGLPRDARAAVDLDVAALGVARTESELDAILDAVPAPLGFEPVRHESGALVLRAWCPLVDATDGPPRPGTRHQRDLEAALRRCADLARWLQRIGATPRTDPAPAPGRSAGPRR